MTKINARIVAALRARNGKASQNDILGCGFTQSEIDQAIKAGAITRIGSKMGACTLFFLSVA